MSKRFLSFIVVICTIFCVLIMLLSDRITLKKELNSDKIQVIDDSKYNTKSSKDDNRSNKDKVSENNNIQKKIESKTNSYVDTDEYKKFKMDKLQQDIKKDKDDFFNKSKTEDNSKYNKDNVDKADKKANLSESKKESSENKENASNSAKEGMPVFKISRYKVKDSLTFTDKEKLLVIASKLSAVDYEKINGYLQKGSDEDIKNTIKLLRERLSDKDYEKVREVAGKFINMDVVEQW